MSYILKALKKSEAERAKGAVPRLTAQQAPAPAARGAAWPLIVGAALVVNAAVVWLVWEPEIALRTGTGRPDAAAPAMGPAAPVPDAAAMTAVAPAAPANGAEPARPIPPPPRRAQPVGREAAPLDLPAAPPPSAPPAPPPQPRTAAGPTTGPQVARGSAVAGAVGVDDANDLDVESPAAPAPGASPVAPPTEQAPAKPNAPEAASAPRPGRKPVEALASTARPPAPRTPPASDRGAPAPPATGPELALASPVPAQPAPPAPEARAEPDPYASVPMLWQLPSVIRSKLPKLSMSVHVYAPEAPGRFVIVDRRKYREGDVLAGGARLEAILADGIVLDFRGQRYRISN